MAFASLEYDYQSLSARYAGFCIYSFGKNSLLARWKDVGNVVMIDVWPRRDTAGRALRVSLKFKVFVCRWGCVSFSRHVQTTAEEVGDYYRGHITHTVAFILFDATSCSQ